MSTRVLLGLVGLAILVAVALMLFPPSAIQQDTPSSEAVVAGGVRSAGEFSHDNAQTEEVQREAVAAIPEPLTLAEEAEAMPLEDGISYLKSRILNADGTAHAPLSWLAQLRLDGPHGGSVEGSAVTPNAEGWILVKVREADAPEGRLRFLAVVTHQQELGIYRMCAVAIPAALPPGITTVADLRFSDRPVISGNLITADGSPLPTCSLSLKTPQDAGGEQIGSMWAGESGRFELYAPFPSQSIVKLEVYPQAPFGPIQQQFPAGAQDLEIVLVAEPAIVGTIILPDGYPESLVDVEAIYEGKDFIHHSGPRNGKFRLPRVPTNRAFGFVVKTWHAKDPLFEAEYVVSEGEQLAPEELNPLDLSGLHWHRLSVVDPQGVSHRNWSYSSEWARIGDAPPTQLQTLAESPDWKVLISAPGYRTEVVSIRDDYVHRLTPVGLTSISLDIPEIPEAHRIRIGFRQVLPLDRGERAFHDRNIRFGADTPRPTVQLGGDGEYEVFAYIERPIGRAARLELPAETAVFRARGNSAFRFSLAPDAFTKALGEGDD